MQWKIAIITIGVMIMSMNAVSGQSKAEDAVIFYVSTDGNDSWSGKLESPDQKDSDGPFKTLQRALDAVRILKKEQNGDLGHPVTIYLRGGTHFLEKPLELNPEDSGTESCPITIAAYQDEKPLVSGGSRITGWRRVDDNLWSVNLPEVKSGEWYFRLLRVGNDWAIRARHPNFDAENPLTGGWLFSRGEDSKEQIVLDDSDFPEWQDWDDAEVHIFPAWGWVNAILEVDGVDKEANTLKVKCSQDIRPGNRFFIANVREALDAPNEWYLDKESGELLYWPADPDFSEKEVVATAMDRLIILRGDASKQSFVEYINFEGLTFTDTDYTVPGGYYSPADASIWLTAARHCSIKDCVFTNSGGYAVRMEQQSSENQIIGNTMKNLGQGGVIMLGKSENQAHDNLIAANDIHDCGLIYKHVVGIYATTSSGNRIIHNKIHRVPRYGISLKSFAPGASSHNNLVEYNEIVDSNLETNDTGAIETLGRDKEHTGNIIRYNFIKNVVGMKTGPEGQILSPHFTWGIYMDDYSSGTTVYGNIVIGTVLGGVCIHGGQDNIVENNILIDGQEHQIRLQPRDSFMTGNVFKNNIIVYRDPEAVVWYSYARTWGTERLKEADFNLYWHINGLDLAKTDHPITPEGNFAKWQAAGFDKNSLIADPMFVDPARDDFSFSENSPALKLGFKPIPVELIGPDGFKK